MTCEFCGCYKPAGVVVCSKCDNNPRLAKTMKSVSSDVKTSFVIDNNGKVAKKVLGRS